MGRARQLVLMHAEDETPLGSLQSVLDAMACFNTAPDGSARSSGTEILHGPGYTVEIASGQDEITQAMVTAKDEDIAWPVLSRLCRRMGWKMVDLESGASFGQSSASA